MKHLLKERDGSRADAPKKAFVAPHLEQHEKLARLTFDQSIGDDTCEDPFGLGLCD